MAVFTDSVFSGATRRRIRVTVSQFSAAAFAATVGINGYTMLSRQPAIDTIAGKVAASTVEIKFGSERASGFLIARDAYRLGVIATVNHAIRDAGTESINIRFSNGDETDALVLAKNEKDDLALLIAKAIPKKMEPVTLGDSGKIRLGERIIEVGNPFGVGSSVTSGIISAVERKVPDMGNAAMIQHDAATNPGNSGGPTAGMDGNVIGMTDEIIAPHLFGPGQNSGVTYAIPSNRFRQWAEVILKARL